MLELQRTQQEFPELIRAAAEPLPDFDDPAFGRMFDRFADARVVLLGEASHGTSEFYRARAEITRRLITEHGFTIVAAEADWPDAASIDRYVRHKGPHSDIEALFQRFPTWMWRNTDVDRFIRWLHRHNAELSPDRRAGFYGLDLYNLAGSIRAVIDHLDKIDPKLADVARERYGCIEPWQHEPQVYGRRAFATDYAECEKGVVAMLRDMQQKSLAVSSEDAEGFLDAEFNARLVRDAEAYYRAMYLGPEESWNLRDRHMFETLQRLLDAKGPKAKAVVWAHNSHIGDARFTDMGRERDELNIGQLCREAYGKDAALIGFGTHSGTVAAATDWDGPMEIKRVNPSRPDSYERLAHDAGEARFLLDLREGRHDTARNALMHERLERFIGVIYRPDTERWSHYATAILPKQFDAYVWFDETTAVTPLDRSSGHSVDASEDETYPSGL